MAINVLVKHPLTVAVLLAGAAVLVAPVSLASGSIGGGSNALSSYGQTYKQGKIVFFRKIACSRADCPIKRSEVDASLAGSLVESLRTRDALKLQPMEHDATIEILCPGDNAQGCGGADEQEMVRYYLSRRFGIGN